jgi:hypothetical protein
MTNINSYDNREGTEVHTYYNQQRQQGKGRKYMHIINSNDSKAANLLKPSADQYQAFTYGHGVIFLSFFGTQTRVSLSRK